VEAWRDLCEANTYTTTIHALNSAIVKLGKLTRAQKIFRGIRGARLPEQALRADDMNIRGGVEFSFMSSETGVGSRR
jgi:NLR family CARD domain-containing protein 3